MAGGLPRFEPPEETIKLLEQHGFDVGDAVEWQRSVPHASAASILAWSRRKFSPRQVQRMLATAGFEETDRWRDSSVSPRVAALCVEAGVDFETYVREQPSDDKLALLAGLRSSSVDEDLQEFRSSMQ